MQANPFKVGDIVVKVTGTYAPYIGRVEGDEHMNPWREGNVLPQSEMIAGSLLTDMPFEDPGARLAGDKFKDTHQRYRLATETEIVMARLGCLKLETK